MLRYDLAPDYETVAAALNSLKNAFPDFCRLSIGCSEEGRKLPCAKIGGGRVRILYAAAFHSLEYITSLVLLRFMEDLLLAESEGRTLLGFDVQGLLDRATFYILPMVNPDGINFVLNGFEPGNPFHDRIWAEHGEDIRRRWQSNIRGVDLNHNYDAMFQTGKELEKEYGIYGPGPTRYGGEKPESECETRAVTRLVRRLRPHLVVALHTQGEEIYYSFDKKTPKKSYGIAKIYSQLTGYTLGDYSEEITSVRGFKDWFIKEFCRPGFTFELGRGKNPLPLSDLDAIYHKILEALLISPYLT